MTRLRSLALVLALLPFAGAASAQTGGPVERMNMAFTTHVFETLTAYDGMIAPENILRLVLIAKQNAVALTCAGFTVDERRYNAAMTEAIGALMQTDNEEGEAITLPLMIAHSGSATLLGGNLARAAYDPEAMCAYGAASREELSEDGGEAVLIWADAD